MEHRHTSEVKPFVRHIERAMFDRRDRFRTLKQVCNKDHMQVSFFPRLSAARLSTKSAHVVGLPHAWAWGWLALLCLLAPQLSSADASLNVAESRAAFLAQPEFGQDLRRLMELEQQALALIEDEPLKMGSLGSAILDLYPASLTGHLAMSRYYEHLETPEAKAPHDQQLEKIQTEMQKLGDGDPTTPFPVMTVYDAHAFARHHELSPVGSIYQSSADAHFGYLLVVRPQQAKLRQIYFDISHLLTGLSPRQPETEALAANPWILIRALAAGTDSAAQTAIGAYLSNEKRYNDAISWLKVASRTGNILANTLLARIYFTQSGATQDPQEQLELKQSAEENYLHAVALGSTDAMYSLANLYFAGEIPGGDHQSGLPLLEQASDLGHAESLLYLAHLYNTGLYIGEDARDKPRSRAYFQRAVELNHPDAILNYGRFLVAEHLSFELDQKVSVEADRGVFTALEKMAKDNDTDAMVVLANLHARGIAPKATKRSAIRWYKRAVKSKPDNPDIVNEVAWTLTVSDIDDLRQARYAKRVMDKLMQQSPAAQERPEYLDTWAATYAANGDFDGGH